MSDGDGVTYEAALRVVRMLADAMERYAEGDDLALETLGESLERSGAGPDEMEAAVLLLRSLSGCIASGPAQSLEAPASGAGETVVPGPPGAVARAPLGVHQSRPLQALQGGEEGAGVHLEDVAGDLLDPAGDAEAVQRREAQGLEDEQVQGALDDVGLGGGHGPILADLLLIVKM